MPSTVPLRVWVDRNDSRYGMRIENSSLTPSGVPRVKIEKDASAPVDVLYIASAAAIFMGWAAVMARLSESPKKVVSAPETTIIHMPNLSAGRMDSSCCLRSRCQAATEMTRPDDTMKQAKIVCGKEARAIGLVKSSPILVSSARPRSSLMRNAIGFCMNAFAARMK